ncbi:MAG: hypothetical protein EA397_10920 [Deltaproteobacteria bacterium]|nr:MAG: hypothetical protein EA397_10920 [Deltaproteobacteria bacterium]
MPNVKLEYSRGDVIASQYEVLDAIQDTPLGPTYRVKHLNSGKFVRLTMLRPEVTADGEALKARFLQAKGHKHPHLIRLGDLSEHNGTPFFTHEDFDGKTLREILTDYKMNNRSFTLKDAAQVVNQILEALTFLHDSEVIVRGLRPEYIQVNARYTGPRQQNFVAQVKLFGAWMFDIVPGGLLVEDEYTRGEVQYLAPELKSFDPVATPRSDLYSVGVVFYEMLTGSPPVGTFLPITQVRPELPALVDDVIELAMAHAPEDRYRSARDLISGIQRVFESAASGEEVKVHNTPLILGLSAIGGVLVLAAVIALYAFVNVDPTQAAMAHDSQLRAQIFEQHTLPSAEEREAVQAKHPDGMIYIPAGEYVRGRLQHDPHAIRGAEPDHQVQHVEGFLIDRFAYPNTPGAHPESEITWQKAQETCQAEGKRLCTEHEWEKACKGPRNFIYSYGDTYDPSICGSGISADHRAGALKECHSGWGVFDLSGGLSEWTASPAARDPKRRIVKGGSLASAERGSRCAHGNDESAGYAHRTIGFRCCRDLDAPPPPQPRADEEDGEGG